MLLAVIDSAGCPNRIYPMDINDKGTAFTASLVNFLDCVFETFVKIAADLILMADLFTCTDSKGVEIFAKFSAVKAVPFIFDNICKCFVGVVVEFFRPCRYILPFKSSRLAIVIAYEC